MTVADILAPLGMRIVVVDTGPLLNDVLRRARQDSITSLVHAARSPSARFFASTHVRDEVEHHLVRRARERGIAPERLIAFWTSEYLPVIRFVDAPVELGAQAAASVGTRDPTDVPTAVLAQLVGADAVLAEDNDLIATGFAPDGWLGIVLAVRDSVAFQSGLSAAVYGSSLLAVGASATIEAGLRHPRLALFSCLLGLGLVGVAWRRGWYPSLATVREAGAEMERMLAEAFESYRRAEAALGRWSPPATGVDPQLAQIARTVARRSPVGLGAVQQTTKLPLAEVRSALASPLFVREASGWTLGRIMAESSEPV